MSQRGLIVIPWNVTVDCISLQDITVNQTCWLAKAW